MSLAGLAIREVAGGWGDQEVWRLGEELAVRMQRMDRTPNCGSSGSGYPCWPRSCRSRCRPRCGSANRPTASPSAWTVMTWSPASRWTTARSAAAPTRPTLWRVSSGRSMWRRPPGAPVAADRGPHPPGLHGRLRDPSSRPLPPATSLPTSGRSGTTPLRPGRGGPAGVGARRPFHPANVVVSDGTLSGIVDFGAMFAGDPAWDLAAASVCSCRARPHGSSTCTRMRTRRRSGAPAAWPL